MSHPVRHVVLAATLAAACGPASQDGLSTFQRVLDDPGALDKPNQTDARLSMKDGREPDVRFVEFEDGDQHLALVVDAPAVLSFRTIVPRDGELRFSLAVRPPRAPVHIELSEANEDEILYEETWQRNFGWVDRRVELEQLEGDNVELQLSIDGAEGTVSFAHPDIVGRIDETRRPNVLVYVVDCLRADHVGSYGYDRPTTPRIDALAEESVVFESSYSCAAWTKASTGCLFTSLNPTFHGAQTIEDVMSDAHPTLAESLRDHGYATAAWIANPFLYERGFGLTRGFDRVVALRKPSPDMNINEFEADAGNITRGVRAWLEQNGDRRFFLYLHSIDAHYRYRERPPFDELLVSHEDEPERTIDLYDNEVAYNDHEIGKLIETLEDLDLYDDTIVVVTSDHGEEFGEHGHERHGKSLHEAALHIPWVMKLPAEHASTARVDALSSNLDVAPTLLDYAGVPIPETFQGRSLREVIETGKTPSERRLFFEQVASTDVLYGVRDGRLKYISRLLPSPEELLYDVVSDPGEARDLLSNGEPPPGELRAALLDYMRLGQRGYHVSVHHPEPDTWIEIEAWTESSFSQVQRFALELGDDFRISEDRKRVNYVFQAKERRRHVVLRTEPIGAPIHIRMRLDGRDWPIGEMTLGEEGEMDGMPIELVPDTVRVSVELVPHLLDSPETYASIWYQLPPVEKTTMPLHPELQERLRALGYLQ